MTIREWRLFILAGFMAFGLGLMTYNQRIEVSAWSAMCQLIEDAKFSYSCGDIERPPVLYMALANERQGRYLGDGIVRININLKGFEQESVLLHEDLHYLHQKLGLIDVPGSNKEICWSEREAWYINGIYDGEDYAMWWWNYPDCWTLHGGLTFGKGAP